MILLILLISATICNAEVNDSGWGRHRAAITGMLTSSDTWQLESSSLHVVPLHRCRCVNRIVGADYV